VLLATEPVRRRLIGLNESGIKIRFFSEITKEVCMYVCNFGSNDVLVIDTDTGTNPNMVIATVSGISSSSGIAYDPVNEEMYVTGSTGPSSEADVIDTTSNPPALVSPPIPVNSGAVGTAYERVNGRMYLANFVTVM
jgi:DNA-binding beta-propeller fold protein YncE